MPPPVRPPTGEHAAARRGSGGEAIHVFRSDDNWVPSFPALATSAAAPEVGRVSPRRVPPAGSRTAGVFLPIAAVRDHGCFGIGDLGSAVDFAKWLNVALQSSWMIFPSTPTAPTESSPYSAISTLGIHPNLIAARLVPEFVAAGGETQLSPGTQDGLRRARLSPRILHDAVTQANSEAFEIAFDRFRGEHLTRGTPRAREFAAFRGKESRWLRDFTLFMTISEQEDWRPWWAWPKPLASRRDRALDGFEARFGDRLAFHAWVQWLGFKQFRAFKHAANNLGVRLCGDMTFSVVHNSADAWANPAQLLRLELGAPPDVLCAEGQRWGNAVLDFGAMRKDDFAWMRRRVRWIKRLVNDLRIDHVVGLFRECAWTPDGQSWRFVPGDNQELSMSAAQVAQGRELISVLASEGLPLVAEDLGVIPPEVRDVLREAGVPGLKVLRWEREYDSPGQPFVDPGHYPENSVVVTGTHDTENLLTYWHAAPQHEREALSAVCARFAAAGRVEGEFSPAVHGALLGAAFQAASNGLIVPWPDLIGDANRINQPGTVGPHNWTYSLPGPASELLSHPQTRELARCIAAQTLATGRSDQSS
ncbi:MAG: 4-alpha-glucanotransferase [Myxococcaceae bacterium]